MKKFTFAALSILFVVSISAQAQTRVGVRAGVTDGDPMIGGEIVIPLGNGFVADPNVEFTSKLFTANADFHYDFPIGHGAAWWLGAGAAVVKPDHGDSGLGVNLLGGYGVRYRNLYPYAQVKLTSARNSNDFASVAVGIRF